MLSKLRPSLGLRFLSTILQKRSVLLPTKLIRQQRAPLHSERSLSTKIAKLSEHPKQEERGSFFQEVAVSNAEHCLEVTWDSEVETNKYPFVWLRDNCQCETCFDQSAQSRTMILNSLNIETKPLAVNISESPTHMQIEWSDGHQSTFTGDWLRQRAFTSEMRERRENFLRIKKRYWGCESFAKIPRIRFNDIMETDEGMLDWLRNLEVFGFVFITGAAAKHGVVRKLAERIAFVRRTHYGEEFSVKAKSDPSNVAYSSGPLQLHADLPYYKYKPGTQLIHCIEQFNGHGGESLVADAMHVAYQFKKTRTRQFELLSTILVDWCDVGQENDKEFYKMLQQPIICLDSKGEIERINFSQPQRDSFFNASFDQVAQWYEAYKDFFVALNSPQYCLRFKMEPGTIQSFDNLRIVHGRTGYDATLGNREIEGCYIDWDEVRSRRRVLQLKVK